jgi:hypothetical protein
MPNRRGATVIRRPFLAPAGIFYVQFAVAWCLPSFWLDATGSFVGIAVGDRWRIDAAAPPIGRLRVGKVDMNRNIVRNAHAGLRFSALRTAGAILLLALALFCAVDEAQATASSSTIVTGSPNPSTQGQIVTFIATLTCPTCFPTLSATGTVTFKDNGVVLPGGAAVPLTAGVGSQSTASISTAALTVGSHTITAISNTTNSGPSSATTTQIVNAVVNTPVATGPTDSQKLNSLQIAGSQIVATTSGQAITGGVQGGIFDAFANGANPITGGPNGLFFSSGFAAEPPPDPGGAFAALAYATKAPGYATKAPPLVAEREWNVWADLRGTGWDRTNNDGDFRGDQFNFTAGVGRKLTPNFLIGLVTGYENFRYNSTSLNGAFKGDGGTIGGYAAWRPASALRFDTTLAWSDINYNAASGVASGSFTGHRWLASGGVTDTYLLGHGFVFEPAAQLYALWENQGAYTDTAGTLQTARSFSVGRASTGGKLAYTWIVAGDAKLTPFAGLYADYRFSSGIGSMQPIGVPILSIVDGWAARLTSGVTLTTINGVKLSGIGELGGIGSGSYNVWSGQVRGSVPF